MPESKQFAASGIEGLDEVLGGGFPVGQSCLIRGASGAGKTTLSLQFLMEWARRGAKALYLGTSETEQEIRQVAQSHGWSLDGVTLHHYSILETGSPQTMLHPAEIDLPRTMESLLAVVDEVAPSVLVIDSLAEIRVLARDELWYRGQLKTLKRHFADRQCTVLLIEIAKNHHLMLDSIVSGVIEMEQITPSYGPDRRRLRVSKIRGQQFVTGYHDYKIKTGGIEVYPRLTAAEHRQRIKRELINTGLAEMDAMFKGGLARGTSVLLLGASGTGKSVVATQMAVAAAERGERSAVFVFDERVQTLFDRAEGIGMPLQRYVDEGLVMVRQVDPAELTAGEFSHAARTLVEADGIQMLIIDSLNGYAYAMPDERMLSVHLHEMSSYLNQQAVTAVFTVTQHGLVFGQAEQPFDLSYLTDTVILFRHFEFAGRIRKAISGYKCRSGAHESDIRELLITSGGVRVGPPLKKFQGILTGAPHYLGDSVDDLHGDH